MAEKYLPAGWSETKVLQGLYKAFGFGMAQNEVDRPTFYIPEAVTPTPGVDEGGVPFNPTVRVTQTHRPVTDIYCALTVDGQAIDTETWGQRQPSEIEIIVLGPDFAQIQGFEYVLVRGEHYRYQWAEPPATLGTIDCHVIHCTSDWEK